MSEAKVYVIHENLEWTQHLVKWLEELEVPYELWDLSSGFWICKVHRHRVSSTIVCLRLLTQEDIAMRQNLQSR